MPTPCRTEVRCALPLTGLNQRDRGACRTTQGDMWLSLLRDRLQEPVFAQRRRVQNGPKKEREQRVAVSWEGRSLPTSPTRESTQRGDGQTDGGGSWASSPTRAGTGGPSRGGCGRWPDDLEDVTAQDAQVLRPAGRKDPRHLPVGVSPHRPPVDGVLLKPLCLQGFHLDILKLLLQASGGDLFPGKVLLPKPSGPLCLSEHFTLNHIFHIILFHLSFCNVCLLYLSYCLSPFLSFFSFPPFSPISLLLHFNASLVNKVSCLCVLIQFESLCILVNKYPFTSILPSFFFLLTVIFLLFFLS